LAACLSDWTSYVSSTELTVANGSHSLTAVARDSTGNQTTSNAVTVTVSNADTTPPTVTITSPANGATVSNTITVTATASDNVARSEDRLVGNGGKLGGGG